MTGKRIKLLLAGGLLIAAAVALAFQLRPRGPLSDDVNFVCAATGKTFRLDRREVSRIPARNPQTGENTLFPCYQSEGLWYVSPRHAGGLQELGEKNRYVDPETLAVRPPQ